jgi:hypothetical protein
MYQVDGKEYTQSWRILLNYVAHNSDIQHVGREIPCESSKTNANDHSVLYFVKSSVWESGEEVRKKNWQHLDNKELLQMLLDTQLQILNCLKFSAQDLFPDTRPLSLRSGTTNRIRCQPLLSLVAGLRPAYCRRFCTRDQKEIWKVHPHFHNYIQHRGFHIWISSRPCQLKTRSANSTALNGRGLCSATELAQE